MYSFRVERNNLRWLYNANLDFCEEMTRVNAAENMADHGSLQGNVFKRKMLSAQRFKGLGAFGAVFLGCGNFTALSLMMGPAFPSIALAGGVMYGMSCFSETETINQISIEREGEHAGMLRISIAQSPFVSSDILVATSNVTSIVALGNDNMGADDTEANFVQINDYVDCASGATGCSGQFTLPADAFRDKSMMDWILSASSNNSTTDADFNDLMTKSFDAKVATGGLSMIEAFNARSTGFSSLGTGDDVAMQIETNDQDTEKRLTRLTETYGRENLEKMPPREFFKLY